MSSQPSYTGWFDCTRTISSSYSSACESIVCSSLRLRPESEIFTGRVVWSTPDTNRIEQRAEDVPRGVERLHEP